MDVVERSLGHGARRFSIPGKPFFIEKFGIPDHRGGKGTKPNIDPVVADPRSQDCDATPWGFVSSVGHFSPLGVSIWGKLPFSRYAGVGVSSGWTWKPSSSKTSWEFETQDWKATQWMWWKGPWGLGPGVHNPGKTLVIEKLGIPDYRGGKVTKPNFDPVLADQKRGISPDADPKLLCILPIIYICIV